ncbi:MAG: hypothetical protein ACN2B6_12635 [Rickettsiales bacterium]
MATQKQRIATQYNFLIFRLKGVRPVVASLLGRFLGEGPAKVINEFIDEAIAEAKRQRDVKIKEVDRVEQECD